MSIEEDLVVAASQDPEIQRILGRDERMLCWGMKAVKSILDKNNGSWRGIENVRIVEDDDHVTVHLDKVHIGNIFLSLEQGIDTFEVYSNTLNQLFDRGEYPCLSQAIDQVIVCWLRNEVQKLNGSIAALMGSK